MNKRAQTTLAEVTAQAHIARAKYRERLNEKRRKLARIALKAFAEASRTEKEPLIDNVTDLICDLKHLCAKKGIDWKRIEFRVGQHTSAEGLIEEPSKPFTESAPKPLTPEQEAEAEYLRTQGTHCPFCKSHDIAAGKPQLDGDVWSDVECLTCKREWKDVFTLSSIEMTDGMPFKLSAAPVE